MLAGCVSNATSTAGLGRSALKMTLDHIDSSIQPLPTSHTEPASTCGVTCHTLGIFSIVHPLIMLLFCSADLFAICSAHASISFLDCAMQEE